MPIVQVKLYSGKIVTATVVKENDKTLWVRLPSEPRFPNGNIIKRHKDKHVVPAQPKSKHDK